MVPLPSTNSIPPSGVGEFPWMETPNFLAKGFLALDWVVISSLATAVGTLVLAVATFSAVRSSNRSARIAEAALQEQRDWD